MLSKDRFQFSLSGLARTHNARDSVGVWELVINGVRGLVHGRPGTLMFGYIYCRNTRLNTTD